MSESFVPAPPAPRRPTAVGTSVAAEASAAGLAGLLPGLLELQAETMGNEGIRVAVLDGPTDLSHPCFQGARLEKIPTLVPEAGPSRHGTQVASLIFGQGAATGISGVAPGVSGLLLPVFAQQADGALRPCSQTDLARAILQALDAGAHVINISGGQLARPEEADNYLRDAVRQAVESNVLVISAVGNEGCECLHVPAALPGVLAVGALDVDNRHLGISNWGEPVRRQGLMAPGRGIPVAVPGGGVATATGTSFATPLVAGAAGLLLSQQKERGEKLDPSRVRQALLESAHPCDPTAETDCRRLLTGILNLPGARRRLFASEPVSRQLPNHQPQGETMKKHTDPSVSPQAEAPEPSGVMPACACQPDAAPPETVQASGPPALENAQPAEAAVPQTFAAPQVMAAGHSTPQVASNLVAPASAHTGVMPSCPGETPNAMLPFPIGQKVFVIGKLNFDFGTEARRDNFVSMISPDNPAQVFSPITMRDFLLKPEDENENNLECAPGLIWTLYIDQDPVYAILPQDQYATISFIRLANFLGEQVERQIELAKEADGPVQNTYRVALAGIVQGTQTLLNGTVVPVLSIATRAMFSWDMCALLDEVEKMRNAQRTAEGLKPLAKADKKKIRKELENFLLRIYHELRNLGVSSQERAKNYAATNIFQGHKIFEKAVAEGLKLDSISVEKSPICRRDSDCWDVSLTFFDPENVFSVARQVYQYTIDVSDFVPVQVGELREFRIFNSP